MKKLYYLLLCLLCLFGISGCLDPNSEVWENQLVYKDVDGVYRMVPLPAELDSLKSMRALPDGNLLAYSNDFYKYYKNTYSASRIPTPDVLVPVEGNIFSLSHLGDAVFYCTPGKVWRKDLSSGEAICLVDSVNATYYSPTASADGRYLTFMRRNHENYWVWKGYPLYVDLQSGEVHSLKSGDSFWDSAVTDCWIDHHRNKFMYSTIMGYSDYFLNSMNMDGSSKAVYADMIYKGAFTADGNYLLTRPYIGYDVNTYRDNNSMLWKEIEDGRGLAIGFSGSLIYYYNSKTQKTYQHNLATNSATLLFDKSIAKGRTIRNVGTKYPLWDDSGIFAIISLKVPTGSSKE